MGTDARSLYFEGRRFCRAILQFVKQLIRMFQEKAWDVEQPRLYEVSHRSLNQAYHYMRQKFGSSPIWLEKSGGQVSS